ncbi:MAG: glycosyltransferase family 4 protein [Thermoanaerobaculia bacterium]
MGLRLLFLTQTFPRFSSDTSGPFIRDLAKGLVALGDSVTVLTPHAAGVRERWKDDGVEVISFRYAPEKFEQLGYSRSLRADEKIKARAALVAPAYLLGAGRALRTIVGARGFDLIHAHWIVPNGLVAGPLRKRVPIAIGLHGSDVFLAERPVVRRWVGRALKQTSLLTGCSPELVERICALGFPEERSVVIPYGVDSKSFSPNVSSRTNWRQKLGISDVSEIVLTVGRMVSKKGFDVLLEALPEVLEECPNAHFIMAGGGDLLDSLRRQTKPWRERVHLPGPVLRDTLPDLFRAADLFVLPAVHDSKGNVDGLPNVILEAMASGLPVVSSDISGIPLAVDDGVEGLLIPEKNSMRLATALKQLLGNPGLRSEMGRAARAKVERSLTWSAIAARYHAAYESALLSDQVIQKNF